MPVYKDQKRGTWYVSPCYQDWTRKRQKELKRGFPTKREALEWERGLLQQKVAGLSMTSGQSVVPYIADMKGRIRKSTQGPKEHITYKKLMPYFGRKEVCEIQFKDVPAWQNEMLSHRNRNGKSYSPAYSKTLHNQFSVVLNRAAKHYRLAANPTALAGNMGKARNGEVQFWTKEEHQKFAQVVMDKPLSLYVFETPYRYGTREGELLALTSEDFGFEKGTVTTNKSYQRIKGGDVVTEPKASKSNRVIQVSAFLGGEIQKHIKTLYGIKPTDRIFSMTESYFYREMVRGAKAVGVKKIRIHDLRHSHISSLVGTSFTALAIADRVGHGSIDIAYRYAHLFSI